MLRQAAKQFRATQEADSAMRVERHGSLGADNGAALLHNPELAG
jgi:hypothetical protein